MWLKCLNAFWATVCGRMHLCKSAIIRLFRSSTQLKKLKKQILSFNFLNEKGNILAYLIIRTIKLKEEVVQLSVSDVLALLPQCRSQPGQTFLGETLYWFVWEWAVCMCVHSMCVCVYALYSAHSAYRFKSTSPTIPPSITVCYTHAL